MKCTEMEVTLMAVGMYPEHPRALQPTGKWRIHKYLNDTELYLECSFVGTVRVPTPWYKRQKYETKTEISWFSEHSLRLYTMQIYTNECGVGL